MTPPAGAPAEVFWAFLKLGCLSFGGPVAHLAHFRREFVQLRGWVDDTHYADCVALCQFLPGPSSSQVGMALGLARAGWRGAASAWLGFTLPSALLMFTLALGVMQGPAWLPPGFIDGLKLAAVAVVAQAVGSMARSLCPDRRRATLALCSALWLLWMPGTAATLGVLLAGAALGSWALPTPALRSTDAPQATPRSIPSAATHRARRAGALLLLTGCALLMLLPLLAASTVDGTTPGASPGPWPWAAIAATYQSGALVFGGGHVVLPLLESSLVATNWLDKDVFLIGYGAAQALPGPIFSFAAYLGALLPLPAFVQSLPLAGAALGAVLLLVSLFLPGFLWVLGALPFWEIVRHQTRAKRALAGINAVVVGVLGAALIHPIGSSALHAPADFGIALLTLAVLLKGRLPVPVVVALSCLLNVARHTWS